MQYLDCRSGCIAVSNGVGCQTCVSVLAAIPTWFKSLLPTCSLEDVAMFVTLESALGVMATNVDLTAMYVTTHLKPPCIIRFLYRLTNVVLDVYSPHK